MKLFYKLLYLLVCMQLLITACKNKEDKKEITQAETGKIAFVFIHKNEGADLVKDTLCYINAAGNQYMVNEIQYFLSDFTLHKNGGYTKQINQATFCHYIDTNIPSTFTWNVTDSIGVGSYDSISFTFGLSTVRNKSNIFVNPPESFMFWPEKMGGGYHYMKLNGKWKQNNGIFAPFNFHLGIGQTYTDSTLNMNTITAFVPNFFTVKLPASAFTITKDKTTTIEIVMNINSWFDTPNVYDFNYWGGSIMQNQAAMSQAAQNGHDVFTIGSIR